MKFRWRNRNVLASALGASLAVTALSASLSSGEAQTNQAARQADRLVIGTMRSPPFVMQADDGKWRGLSIELWEKVAADRNIQYEYRSFDYDPEGLNKALEIGEIDAAIIASPVTPEGEVRFDYTQPYATSGLIIAARTGSHHGVLHSVAGAFSSKLLFPIAIVTGLLLFVGALIWLIERHRNPQHFSQRALAGIGDGIWWAAVTMTTTGYGDKTPVTSQGRLLGLVWMFASIFCVATFSATLASSFVVERLQSNISGPSDLPRVKVGVVAGSEGEVWARQYGLTTRSYPFVIQASKALRRGEIDALIFERAVLAHMMREYGWSDLTILPQPLATSAYAIVLPPDSPRKEMLNRAVLRVVYSPEWRSTLRQYLRSGENVPH
jgi:polar amino acid transport system substrate-binding protein